MKTEALLTHRNMTTTHYICYDVLSDHCSNSISSYTHHRSTATPHYVCACVSSDGSSDWVPY